jgi:hypothetical protein
MHNLNYRYITGIAIAALLSGLAATMPQPQVQRDDCLAFPTTGHYVCSEFRTFFETQGSLEIFGYPLTEAFNDDTRGLQVQYFQRARMELHPYNQAPYRVQLGLLVDELGYSYPPPVEIPPFNTPLRRYFPETGHIVSHDFLTYFNKKGGVDIFGYPRSEIMYENGYIVQYFQRARLEWHPEAMGGPQMQLTNWGEIYLDRFNISTELTRDRIGETTGLRVTASVRHIITGQEENQTIFVYVTNQWEQPIPGAAIRVTIHYSSQDSTYELPPTNESGFTRHDFEQQPSAPGQKVVIDVRATYSDLTAKTQTFFLPWW